MSQAFGEKDRMEATSLWRVLDVCQCRCWPSRLWLKAEREHKLCFRFRRPGKTGPKPSLQPSTTTPRGQLMSIN